MTWDDAKLSRDGHTSAGRLHPQWSGGLRAVFEFLRVTERDEHGRPVRWLTTDGGRGAVEWERKS